MYQSDLSAFCSDGNRRKKVCWVTLKLIAISNVFLQDILIYVKTCTFQISEHIRCSICCYGFDGKADWRNSDQCNPENVSRRKVSNI